MMERGIVGKFIVEPATDEAAAAAN